MSLSGCSAQDCVAVNYWHEFFNVTFKKDTNTLTVIQYKDTSAPKPYDTNAAECTSINNAYCKLVGRARQLSGICVSGEDIMVSDTWEAAASCKIALSIRDFRQGVRINAIARWDAKTRVIGAAFPKYAELPTDDRWDGPIQITNKRSGMICSHGFCEEAAGYNADVLVDWNGYSLATASIITDSKQLRVQIKESTVMGLTIKTNSEGYIDVSSRNEVVLDPTGTHSL